MAGELLMAIFTGIALPAGMLVVKRHYSASPNAWEGIFVLTALGLVGCGAGFLIFEVLDSGSFGQLIRVPLAGWVVALGLYVLIEAGARARNTVRETRAKPPT
jgi:asparagine N-glycosylation enzyme membrane subunit Stt3